MYQMAPVTSYGVLEKGLRNDLFVNGTNPYYQDRCRLIIYGVCSIHLMEIS